MSQSVLPPWVRLETIFNLIVGVASLVTFGMDLVTTTDQLRSILDAVAFIALLIAFLGYAYITSRKERYADITSHIENVADRCRKARRRVRATSDLLQEDSGFLEDLQVILTDVSTIFSMLTGVRCRVALKTFRPLESGAFYCRTLARDHLSAPAYHNGDRRRADAKFDTLDKNPHLLSLFSNDIDGEDWEVFNDIPKMICERRYASSTLLWEMKVAHSVRGDHDSHTLPYVCSATALIRSKEGVPLAFIGVDCNAKRVFRERSDGALLASLGCYIGPLLEDALIALDVADAVAAAATNNTGPTASSTSATAAETDGPAGG